MTYHIGQQIGNYRLLRKLGQGSFAEVYLGEHLYLERLAAIKVLHMQIEPETQEQFRLEARTIAHLQHPHILSVLDFGIQEQIPYLVTEYTPGGTLRAAHPKGTRLPLEQIVLYVKQIALALDYAHQQKVIHRDVKPDNLLLNVAHEVVLSDFGIAVVQQTLSTLSTQNFAGTPLYMAPEQIQYKPCAASDQYALGIVVYEWLTGAAPFQGTFYTVLQQHLYEAPPSLRTQLPDLPIGVEEAVFKALSKDPKQRFTCIEDFALVLEEACLATQPLIVQMPITQAQEGLSFTSLAQRTVPVTKEKVHPPPSQQAMHITPQALMQYQNRMRLLRRVRSFWITGVLDQSLHGAALITLGLQKQTDVMSNPWHMVLYNSDKTPHALPPGTHITEVYDDANGELLILGAPGSGKTTLLLELARYLLDIAERDEQHPIPVVFTLSSWTVKHQRLSHWLVEELINKYQVPHKLAHLWVDTEQILPLLDGLDEVTLENRTACIATINAHRQEHGLLPLVVSSRSADYLAQDVRIKLNCAISVQPLTMKQVDNYLKSGKESLWTLRVALHQDEGLRELTETPLMLSILALTYHDMPVEDLLREGVTPTRQQIFMHYVERMLSHPSAQTKYKPHQTVQWLTLLAKQLINHNQTQFYLERMQPDWLPQRWSQWLYHMLAIKPMDLLIGILVSILIGTLHSGPLGIIAYGVIGFLIALLISWRGKAHRQSGDTTKSWWRLIRISSLFVGAIVQLIIGLSYEMLFKVSISLNDVLVDLVVGALIGLTIGALLKVRQTDIKPVEVVLWSWERFFKIKHLRNGILTGLLFGTINALIFFPSGPFLGLFGAIIGWLLSGLLDALSSDMLDGSRRAIPNQGIRRSARSGLLIGLIVGQAAGLIIGLYLTMTYVLYTGPLNGPTYGILRGVAYGLGIGLLAWLFGGGDAYIKHLVLRLLLWGTRSIPWNYSRFLDHAAERVLLRKVGGGYIFIHRFLLEYFASLDVT